MTIKGRLYFPSLVVALLIGVLLGTKTCKGDGNKHVTNVSKRNDTTYITKFVEGHVDTIYKDKEKVVIKTVLLRGSTDTITKIVTKIEYQVQTKYQDKFIKDSTCFDSIQTYKDLVQELNDSVAKLQEYKTFRGQIKNKLYKGNYAILGRDVTNVAQTIKLKNRVELTPILGTSFVTNGKAVNEFTYLPYVGLTVNYNKFTTYGGFVWNPQSDKLNTYLLGVGFNLKL